MRGVSFILFLFSLINPLDVGVVNLTFGGFCSKEMEDMGLKSHQWMCLSKGCCSQLKSLLNLLFTAKKSMLNLLFTAQESIAGVYCPQLKVYAGVLLLTAQLTTVDFIYHM